jgi:uroporphyrinogen decarboxylase
MVEDLPADEEKSMSRKNDMIHALSGAAIPKQVPTWELEFHLWNHFSDKRFVVGQEFASLSAAQQESALAQNAELMAAVSEQLGFAAVTIPPMYWESAPGHPAYFWLPDEARVSLLKQLQALTEDLFFVVHTGGVIGLPGAEEYMEFAYKLFDAPEEIDAMARSYCDGAKAEVRRWADLGADGFLSTADQADNSSPYFNPEQLDRFVYPYLKEWADEARAAGGYSIMHSDGNIFPMLGNIADCGVNAVQALDPTAGIDLAEVKQLVGDRLTLCGNVDCGLVLTGTPEEVYEAAFQTLETGAPGGRFVFGGSNVIEGDAKKENFEAMCRAWKNRTQNLMQM